MFDTKREEAEDGPLRDKNRGLHEEFLSGTWLLAVLTATLVLSLGGFLLHSDVSRSQDQLSLNVTLPLKAGKLPAAWSAKFKTILTAEDFGKCNVALPPAELSGSRADATLAGNQCGQAEAVSIASALRAAGYNFEATVPQPYIFPGYLQQVLWMLEADHITTALKHLQLNAPAGKLGTLVKLFAWGLPVPVADLEAALDSSALSALLRCQLLAPCLQLPGMTTSTAMLFPVPNTTVLMATDWASRSTVGMSEHVVPIVSPESMALIYNSPTPTALNVLDLDSGTGVHGMVAAQRGAASVTLFTTNVRAMRFGRFSSWLNDLASVISVLSAEKSAKGLQSAFELALAGWQQVSGRRVGKFDLVLAQPSFLPVPDDNSAAMHPRNGGPDGYRALQETVAAADNALDQDGIFALVTDFALPDMLSPLGCGPLAAPLFSGSLILKRNPFPIKAFAAAHNALASVSAQVANMQKHGVTAVSNGLLFAKRVTKDRMATTDGCGIVSLHTLPDPFAWPTPGADKSNRPCFLSQETDCLDI